MNKKVVSMSLAALMMSQSAAFAQVDRTQGVADQAISQAKKNMSALQAQLTQLDKALQETEDMITKRDNSGGITNGLSIGAAAVGIGLTSLAMINLKLGGEGRGLGSMFLGAGALISTLTSIVTGGGSALLKSDAETAKIDQQLAEVEAEISKAKNLDKESASALVLLSHSVSEMRATLKDYQKNEDSTDRNRLLSHAAQAAGAAVMFFSLRSRVNATATMGLVLLNAGSLSRIITGMSDSQADQVLKEIRSTRTSLKLAAGSLE